MSKQTKHTPGPWMFDKRTVIGRNALGGWSEICSQVQGQTPEHADGNARFIVRAVNCHDDLVAALQCALAEIIRLESHVTRDQQLFDFGQIRAAISKAAQP